MIRIFHSGGVCWINPNAFSMLDKYDSKDGKSVGINFYSLQGTELFSLGFKTVAHRNEALKYLGCSN